MVTTETTQRNILKNTSDKSNWNSKNIQVTHRKIGKRETNNKAKNRKL